MAESAQRPDLTRILSGEPLPLAAPNQNLEYTKFQDDLLNYLRRLTGLLTSQTVFNSLLTNIEEYFSNPNNVDEVEVVTSVDEHTTDPTQITQTKKTIKVFQLSSTPTSSHVRVLPEIPDPEKDYVLGYDSSDETVKWIEVGPFTCPPEE